MNRFCAVAVLVVSVGCASSKQPGVGGSAADPSGGPAGELFAVEKLVARDDAQPAPVLQVMQDELGRSMAELKKLAEQAPYFVSYQVTDRGGSSMGASLGALMRSSQSSDRTLDVDVRVGNHELDNTRPARGAGPFGGPRSGSWKIPMGDDPAMLRRPLWLATNAKYRDAVEMFLNVRGNEAIKTKAEDSSPDFSREKPLRFVEEPARIELDRSLWEKKVRAWSKVFDSQPDIHASGVSLQVETVTKYMANSEGSSIQVSRPYVRLSIFAETRAEDGMELSRWEAVDATSLAGLGDDAAIRRLAQQVATDLVALRRAPLAEPYMGPAILEGEAAGVYFHEIFGHRVEGHRQKDEEEGQTFAKKIGKPVMPSFIDVYDDPTIRSVNGIDLNGAYSVDDEAVAAQRATLVERGVLKNFLMSRSPTRGFTRSNSHGRRQEGNRVVARQANLVVHPRRVVSPAELKRRLIAEVKRQGKEYGLRFTVVQGGFTNTGRFGIQAFKVVPIMVYRVYPDGREELIRGATIDGTPLTSLSQILAAGTDVAVFNGYCGAESGFIPVSATSPSLLVARVEISRAPSQKEKPPLLPAPAGSPSVGGAR